MRMYDVYYLLNCTRRSFQLLVGFSYREMAPPPSKSRCLKVSRKPLGTRSLFLLARFALNIAQCLFFRIQFLFPYCLFELRGMCRNLHYSQSLQLQVSGTRSLFLLSRIALNNKHVCSSEFHSYQKIHLLFLIYCLFYLGFGHFGRLMLTWGPCRNYQCPQLLFFSGSLCFQHCTMFAFTNSIPIDFCMVISWNVVYGC